MLKLMDESGYWNRRRFIRTSLITGAGVLVISNMPLHAFAKEKLKKITILHTNDVHSRIEPFPMDGSKHEGKGGFARRAALVNSIRKTEKNVLLFDAGDIFQGTPYFNYFKGETEIKLMSAMGYNASAIGNHDFDAGIDRLGEMITKYASFPFINSNYVIDDTPLQGKVIKNKVFGFNGFKVGVYGLGIKLEGLAPAKLFGKVIYSDPLTAALEQEEILKNKEKCDLIICLSHLGFKNEENKMNDMIIAQNTKETNLIIGGHTHTFMSTPEVVSNSNNKDCSIFQVGWGGINLGRVDFTFDKKNNPKLSVSNSLTVF